MLLSNPWKLVILGISLLQASVLFADPIPQAATLIAMNNYVVAEGTQYGIGDSTEEFGAHSVQCVDSSIFDSWCAQGVASIDPYPYISASAFSGEATYASSSVQLSYWYEVVGPDLDPGSYIPVLLSGTMGCNYQAPLSGTGGLQPCSATVTLFGENLNLNAIHRTVQGNDPYEEPVISNYVLPNVVYSVKLTVTAQTIGGGAAFGWIDPLLSITGGLDELGYSLVLSDGVVNANNPDYFPDFPDPGAAAAPEPSAALLIVGGIIGLFIARSRSARLKPVIHEDSASGSGPGDAASAPELSASTVSRQRLAFDPQQ